jgi:glutamate racemase
MDSRPILFFDSGVGGLSVLGPARALLPQASFVYAADSAGFPYGTKSEAEIAARVPALLGRLAERYQPRLIVIACNTASTIALAAVRAALALPIVGTVPAIKPAAELSRTRVIGVLGTDATVRQPYVDDLSARFANDCTVLRHGSADLVQAAEETLHGETVDPARFRAALAGLFDQPEGNRIDVIVNACTHFPLVEAQLSAAAGDHRVGFVDGGAGIARRIADLTRGQDWAATPAPGRAVFTRLGDDERRLAPALAAFGLVAIDSL